MRMRVLAVGAHQPEWVNQAYREYARRFPPHLELELREIPAAKRGKTADPAQLNRREGERLLKAITNDTLVIALDERGDSLDTRALAQKLSGWMQAGRNVDFLIGGADGLDAACLQRADWRWSLSPLTLPHGLVRILLAEQLYRAWSLLEGHPYHRE